MTERLCAVCGTEVYRTRFLFKKNSYQVVQCAMCDFVFVHPPPTPQELKRFYDRRDYFEAGNAFGYADYTTMSRQKYGATWSYRLDQLGKRMPTCGVLLDLGCATGTFLKMARERGWTVAGVELSAYAAKTAQENLGIPVARSIHHVPSASVDALTAWEYIEHLIDPTAELREVWRVLKPGGWFALSTPNTQNLLANEDLWAWAEMKPPEHLAFFTAETLTRWLTPTGFVSIYVEGIVPIGLLYPTGIRRFTRMLDHLGVGPTLRKIIGRRKLPSALLKPAPVGMKSAAIHSCLGLLAFAQKPG